MTDNSIFIGVDASKGYADFRFINQQGNPVLPEEEVLDDTPDGHDQFRETLQNLQQRFPNSSFVIGIESTGGYERNWLNLFSKLKDSLSVQVYRINPDLIRRFKDQGLHNISTDSISAEAIAEYLRVGLRPEQEQFEPEKEGLRTRARLLMKQIDHASDLKNEFQSLLVQIHPYLVASTRDGIPQWVLRLVTNYPSSSSLAGADPETVAEIPYLTEQRATSLIEKAHESVAGRQEPASAASLRDLAEDLLSLTRKIKRRKEQIYQELKEDPGVKIMRTIPGIGKWSASLLRLEIGPIHRFPNSEKLIAYSGLDPVFEESGDEVKQLGISKQGSTYIRRILFPCVQSGLQQNPPIKSFYDRLTEKGKHHMVAMVACMRKLLSITYACWVKQEPFDPGYEKRLKEEIKQKQQSTREKEERPESEEEKLDLSAPVSRKEAQRRKKLQDKQKKEAQPQESGSSHLRGQRAPGEKQ